MGNRQKTILWQLQCMAVCAPRWLIGGINAMPINPEKPTQPRATIHGYILN
jgi:hypothetical protein